jgi:hypothetical protein
MNTNMRLRPYDLDALTRAVCAHMLRNGIDVVMVDEGMLQTPDHGILHVTEANLQMSPMELANGFADLIRQLDNAGGFDPDDSIKVVWTGKKRH